MFERESLRSGHKGGDKECVYQEEAIECRELGDVTAAVATCPSDVSYPKKRNKKGWQSTETN